MLGFVQNIFAVKAHPIGVDFGSDCLRLAQVQQIGANFKLVAAASADVPENIRHEPRGRLQFFVEQVRQLLEAAPFRGRQAVLALPAASTHIQHLRLDRMNDEALKKTIPAEALGKLPIDPSLALLRYYVAGQIQPEQDGKLEIIVMAAIRQSIEQLLNAAVEARLDIVGMNVEPMAVMDCFNHVYRRKSDANVTQCLVDMGSSGTRAAIARDGQLMFARDIAIGGDQLTRAAASALSIGFRDARTLRIKLAATDPPPVTKIFPMPVAGAPPPSGRRATDGSGSLAVVQAATEDAMARPSCVTTVALAEQARQVEEACRQTVSELAAELDLCRRDHESAFPNAPVDRLVFVGGEARQRQVCRQIANQLGLTSQLGDPMCRMIGVADAGIQSGMNPNVPQPAWATAIGLSMGPRQAA
jgi:type IV pilus assembly protein PilM